MIDVALASGSYWPREGGAERQMRSVLENAAAAGGRLSVVTRATSGSARSEYVNNVRVSRVGFRWAFRLAPPLGQAIFVVWLTIQLVRLKPKRVVSIQLGTSTLAASLATRILGIPHVIRLTGGGTTEHRSEPLAKASSRIGRASVNFAARRTATVIAPARHLLNDFEEAFPNARSEVKLVPNGTATPPESSIQPDEVRQGVVWYARNGSERSTDSFANIANKTPQMTFRVIGQPLNFEAKNVEDLGWVNDPFTVLGRSRVLLNTSPTEGMPNTVLQALAAGMWVVGPTNQGLLEIRKSYPDRVVLIDMTDPEAVAELLQIQHSKPLPTNAQVPSSSEVSAIWADLLNEDE